MTGPVEPRYDVYFIVRGVEFAWPGGKVCVRPVITESLGHHSIERPTAETVVFCGVYMYSEKFMELYKLACS